MYQNIPTKVLTGEVRLSYANLTAPRAAQQGGDAKYGVTLLIPKTDTATYQDIVNSIEAAAQDAQGNLVKNALDHTKAGAQILITWKKLPAVTQITVKDDGHGIHPKDIHHIFKRFYRSRFSKDTQGVGLGLPLAKAIVEANDGNISVDSDLDNGSCFVMSFLNLTKE